MISQGQYSMNFSVFNRLLLKVRKRFHEFNESTFIRNLRLKLNQVSENKTLKKFSLK